jgi:uncharacterized protein
MLLVDTGFLLALLDKKDSRHSQALTWAHSHAEGWITTWPVLTEAVYMLTTHLDARSAVHVMDDVASGVLQVWDIPLAQVGSLSTLMKRYKALPMDLADASLVLLADHRSARLCCLPLEKSAAVRRCNAVVTQVAKQVAKEVVKHDVSNQTHRASATVNATPSAAPLLQQIANNPAPAHTEQAHARLPRVAEVKLP